MALGSSWTQSSKNSVPTGDDRDLFGVPFCRPVRARARKWLSGHPPKAVRCSIDSYQFFFGSGHTQSGVYADTFQVEFRSAIVHLDHALWPGASSRFQVWARPAFFETCER